MKQIPNDTLIYDIETWTFNNMNNVEPHLVRFIGCYSYKTNEYIFLDDINEFKRLVKKHKYVVGFNNKNYDNKVLRKYGITFDYKIIIDLYRIIQDRAALIKWKNSILAYHLPSMTLDDVSKELKLVNEDTSKKKIDYSILEKEEYTNEEIKQWKEYTLRDIEVTKKLFEWFINQFDSWKFHLNEKDKRNLKYITSSTAVYAYKVVCHRLGIEEEYNEYGSSSDNEYHTGAYVSYPAGQKFEGKIYCLDFNSLYPHCFIQANLFGRLKNGEQGYNGNGQIDILGTYNDKQLHPISKVLMDIYKERVELKKLKDPREMGLKIVLNSLYGATRNPAFKHIYDQLLGEDCCRIAQYCIRTAKKIFKQNGYMTICCDTDSLYFQLQDNQTEEDMLKIKDEVIKEIKSNLSFPSDTFDMGIDYRIKCIHFVYGDQTEDKVELDEDDKMNKQFGLIKKNYCFLTEEDKVIIKNLNVTKRSCSQLSKKIFWEKIVPIFKEEKTILATQNEIINWIKEYLEQDIKLIMKRFSVRNLSAYKSKTCMSAQIHEYIPKDKKYKLGPGFHFLLPNKKFGVGKGLGKYCTYEEYTKYCTFNDLNLNVIIKELKYFIKDFQEILLRKKKQKPLDKLYKQIELW